MTASDLGLAPIRLPRRMCADSAHPASYRDPSGYLFQRDGVLYRHVTRAAATDYDALVASGLYDELSRAGKMVAHQETPLRGHEDAHRVLRPEPIEMISYPYEWAFSQLQDAALLTIDLAERALDRGLMLRDASAFNVQFRGCVPLFIDTLSFAPYRAGEPWVAYRQFCEQFLAPLAIMAFRDARLAGLWRANLEGVPLDLATRLLPRTTWLRFGLLTHLWLHARSQAFYADRPLPTRRVSVPRRSLLALLGSLRAAVRRLPPPAAPSAWADYDQTHGYAERTGRAKEETVRRWLEQLRPRRLWDLGGNLGRFSQIATALGAYAVCCDLDPAVVDAAYRRGRAEGRRDLLPLVVDLANPSPGLGWESREREALESRGPADALLALALVHHLAITRNVPLERIAHWLACLGRDAIVEFVPKQDPQVSRLLRSRQDVFDRYSREGFEAAFGERFRLGSVEPLPDSGRILYLWHSRG